jgi:hypothetical protein
VHGHDQASISSQRRLQTPALPVLGLYRLVAGLTLLGVAAQFFLAGAGAFGATSYDAHRTLGSVLIAIGALGVILAATSRTRVVLALALEVALLLQLLLGHLGTTHPWIGAIHGLVAIGVAALASAVARGLGMRPHGAKLT